MRLLNRWLSKKLLILIATLFILLFSFPFIYRLIVQQYYGQQIFDVDAVPAKPVALVFGAGIYENGDLSDMLRDRMDVAIALYKAGKVEKLLLSGDNRFEDYNEPGAMLAYALMQGVDQEDVQPDYGGRRTYDSCYRAKYIFEVQETVLITQNFHLPRALMLCQQLGIEVVGVSADLQPYLDARWMTIREVGATLQSGWELIVQAPPPVMGETIPIAK